MKKKLKIKLIKSFIGYSERQRRVLKGLGLRKINDEVMREDTPSIRGMIKKVSHLLEIKEE
ncbi:MAG: 50S ribosomal protein L30 [Acidobacteriota bacterium]